MAHGAECDFVPAIVVTCRQARLHSGRVEHHQNTSGWPLTEAAMQVTDSRKMDMPKKCGAISYLFLISDIGETQFHAS